MAYELRVTSTTPRTASELVALMPRALCPDCGSETAHGCRCKACVMAMGP
jgi:hypothetical protein